MPSDVISGGIFISNRPKIGIGLQREPLKF